MTRAVKKTTNYLSKYYDSSSMSGRRGVNFNNIKTLVQKNLNKSYIDRKLKKGVYRKLNISNINNVLSNYGISYSSFINNLSNSNVQVNRFMLSNICLTEKKSLLSLLYISSKITN